jgi:hypothetical protein
LKENTWLKVEQRFNNSCRYSFDWDQPSIDELADSAEAEAGNLMHFQTAPP